MTTRSRLRFILLLAWVIVLTQITVIAVSAWTILFKFPGWWRSMGIAATAYAIDWILTRWLDAIMVIATRQHAFATNQNDRSDPPPIAEQKNN